MDKEIKVSPVRPIRLDRARKKIHKVLFANFHDNKRNGKESKGYLLMWQNQSCAENVGSLYFLLFCFPSFLTNKTEGFPGITFSFEIKRNSLFLSVFFSKTEASQNIQFLSKLMSNICYQLICRSLKLWVLNVYFLLRKKISLVKQENFDK